MPDFEQCFMPDFRSIFLAADLVNSPVLDLSFDFPEDCCSGLPSDRSFINASTAPSEFFPSELLKEKLTEVLVEVTSLVGEKVIETPGASTTSTLGAEPNVFMAKAVEATKVTAEIAIAAV